MTTEQLMDDLVAIDYSDTRDYTITRRFKMHDEDFESFVDFPLIVVETGPEEIDHAANRMTTSFFHPKLHLLCEDQTSETMEGWREDIRGAVYGDSTLAGHTCDVRIDSIVPVESEERKLQHLEFSLTVEFDQTHS